MSMTPGTPITKSRLIARSNPQSADPHSAQSFAIGVGEPSYLRKSTPGTHMVSLRTDHHPGPPRRELLNLQQ
eukprot:3499217-Alexandrium_andersonii.AAC.1